MRIIGGEGRWHSILKVRRAVGAGGKATHSVGDINEGVVDGDNFNVVVLDGVAEDDTANAAETVDANLNGSHCS